MIDPVIRVIRLGRTIYIMVWNLKGGIGKTTLTTHIAYYLSKFKGLRVLVVDCDMQSNCLTCFTKEKVSPTISHVFLDKVPFYRAIHQVRDNLFVLPSDMRLDETNKHIIAQGIPGYTSLRRSLKALEQGKDLDGRSIPDAATYQFDVVFFDNPAGNISPLTEAAIKCSDSIISPVEPLYLSYDGIFNLIEKMQKKALELEQNISIMGIVPYNLDQRIKMSGTYVSLLHNDFGEYMLSPVRTSAEVNYAQSHALTMFEHAFKSAVTADLQVVGGEVYDRIIKLTGLAPQEVAHV